MTHLEIKNIDDLKQYFLEDKGPEWIDVLEIPEWLGKDISDRIIKWIEIKAQVTAKK